MFPDSNVPLAHGSPGCLLEDRIRSIQNGSNVYHVSLNQDYLKQLGLHEQGAGTKHSLAMGVKPVEVVKPAYIIQPVDVLESSEVFEE